MKTHAEFDPGDERMARAAWSRLAEPDDHDAQDRVAADGAPAALAQVLSGRGPVRWQERRRDLNPARDIADLHTLGGRILIPGDPEWPGQLAALDTEAPFCLWVRGPLHLGTATTRSTALTGARAATAYGEHVAADLGEGCARREITVISGAAYGVDGAAHRGALAADGATIAVLACGVDQAYPRAHDQLIWRITQTGAVISELPPRSAPNRIRFIARNRLIAALSGVSVIVEAAHRSGALAVAAQAARLGHPVGGVPGPITSPGSVGVHQLLRRGAVCVTSAAELAELLQPQ